MDHDTSVSRVVFESEMARAERNLKRLWVLVLILICLFVGSNLAWIAYESQYEDIVITAEQSADSGNNYAVGGDFNGD